MPRVVKHRRCRLMALPGRKLGYTNWLNLRQLTGQSGRQMGCGLRGLGLKMDPPETLAVHCGNCFSPYQRTCLSGYNAVSLVLRADMRRREFIMLLGDATAWPLAARAQQPARYRIGHLAIAAPTDTPPPPPANWDAFVQGLREAGYTEGQNIAFEHRSAHDQPELFPKLAFELASLKVDAIFARGTWALAAAKNATRMIPIVGIDLEIDPVEAGLVASIARPGGNITGLFLDLSELSGKHLQILKEIIPATSRVAVLGDSNINAPQLRELKRVAQSLALQTQAVELKDASNLEGAFESAKNWGADALIVLSNPLALAYRTRIAELAAKARLPTIYLYRAHVDAGGLISYGPDLPDMFRRAGGYVGRILGGTKPADLPIERPARFDMVVNLRTAKALGITIPEMLLVRADEVIE